MSAGWSPSMLCSALVHLLQTVCVCTLHAARRVFEHACLAPGASLAPRQGGLLGHPGQVGQAGYTGLTGLSGHTGQVGLSGHTEAMSSAGEPLMPPVFDLFDRCTSMGPGGDECDALGDPVPPSPDATSGLLPFYYPSFLCFSLNAILLQF